jgi:hypothetical protein
LCRSVHLLDCCNGLLLCRRYDDISNTQDDDDFTTFTYVVCNPATEEWAVLPDRGQDDKVVGVGVNLVI